MEKAFGKTLSLLCLALCLTFAVSACGGADPLVGTWTDNNEDGLTITFTQDHTFAISSESGTMLTGTYALDGETLELKCDQASLQAGPWSIECINTNDKLNRRRHKRKGKPFLFLFLPCFFH